MKSIEAEASKDVLVQIEHSSRRKTSEEGHETTARPVWGGVGGGGGFDLNRIY